MTSGDMTPDDHSAEGNGRDKPRVGEDPSLERDDGIVDAVLRRRGEELRSGRTNLDPGALISGSIRGQLTRTRRFAAGLTVVCLLLAVAVIATLVTTTGNDRPAGNQHVPRGSSSAAVRLVNSLPAQPVDPHKVKLVASVSRYDTCDTLIDELHRVGAEHVGSRGFGGFDYAMPMAGYGRMAATKDANQLAVAPGGEESAADAVGETLGTNVVVAGVDEPDIVKAAGAIVVDLVGNKLRVTDTTSAAVLSTLDLAPPGEPDAVPVDPISRRQIYSGSNSLMLEGTRAVVFGSESVPAAPLPGDPSATRPADSYLTVTFVDLSDPAAPKVAERIRIQGAMVTARRVGDQVRLLTTSSLAELPMVLPTGPNSVAAALHQNRLAVAESAASDWIPQWDRGEGTPMTPLVECSGVIVPDTFAGVQMTSLVQFDLAGSFAPRSMSILAPAEDLTANATDVVVASHVWVDPAKQSDDFSDWATALHRFTFTESGPSYVGSGSVPGSVRDQFSLSVIDEDTLGVVTVDVVPWNRAESAKVTVRTLSTDAAANRLNPLGELVLQPEGGVGGVRFLGERLLVSAGLFGTSFEVIDLSDGSSPKDLGTLELGGTGDYIHPVAENRVLILGSFLTPRGRQVDIGVQALLVDLSAAPVVVSRWAKDNAYTAANSDHHAFTWWPSRSLAAFGITNSSRGGPPPPAEAAFLSVAGDSLSPRLVRPQNADLGPRCRIDQLDRSNCDDTDDPSVTRVLVVNGAPWLYTSESLEGLDPESFESRAVVPLRWQF